MYCPTLLLASTRPPFLLTQDFALTSERNRRRLSLSRSLLAVSGFTWTATFTVAGSLSAQGYASAGAWAEGVATSLQAPSFAR